MPPRGGTAGHTTRSATSWLIVSLAVGAGVLVALQVGKVIISLPRIREEFGIDLGSAGLLVSSYTIVGALFGLGTGRVVDRVGTVRSLVACLFIVAGGSALGSVAPTMGLLLASRLVEGVGYVGVVVAAPSLMTSRSLGHRLPLSLWGLYLPLGQAVMLIVGPSVLAMVGWRGLWTLNALLLAVHACVCWGILGRDSSARRPPREQPHGGPVRSTLRHRPILTIATIFGLYSFQYLSVVGFLPTIYTENDVADATAGYLTAVVAAGNVVGILISIALLRRGVRAGTLMCVASLGTAVAVVAIYESPPRELALGVAAATAFTVMGGLLPSAVFASVPVCAPSLAAIAPANGLVIQASNVGSLLGAPILGSLAHATGTWAYSPAVLSTLALAAFGISLDARRIEAGFARDG